MDPCHQTCLKPMPFHPTIQSHLVWGFRASQGLFLEGSLRRAGLGEGLRGQERIPGCSSSPTSPLQLKGPASQFGPHHLVSEGPGLPGKMPSLCSVSSKPPGVWEPDSPERAGVVLCCLPQSWQAACGGEGAHQSGGVGALLLAEESGLPLTGKQPPGPRPHAPPCPRPQLSRLQNGKQALGHCGSCWCHQPRDSLRHRSLPSGLFPALVQGPWVEAAGLARDRFGLNFISTPS